MKPYHACKLIGAALLLSFAVAAADKQASVNASDEKFIKKVAEAGKVEAALSELAVQKATRSEVKELAQSLHSEHATVNEGLSGLATRKGVQISAIIEPSGAAKFKELEKLSGKPFDDAFLSWVSSSHRRLIAMFEDRAKDAADPDLKAFIEGTLPTLRGHLDKTTKLLPADTQPVALPPI